MMKYIICGLCLQLDGRTGAPEDCWKSFEGHFERGTADAEVFIGMLWESLDYGCEVYDLKRRYVKAVRREHDIMLVSENWKHNVILPLENPCYLQTFLIQTFYSHAVRRHMLQCHSSLVQTDGGGLMFLGPSGIGKTTQAELWHKYRDAVIVNGDIVYVEETEDGFFGWGTPWHGSSPYCENMCVPLRAMIVLKQAGENKIRRLSGFEKVSRVSGQIFYPRWLTDGMELCLKTLDHLLEKVPVYELSCRPDEGAVAAAEAAIFRKAKKGEAQGI